VSAHTIEFALRVTEDMIRNGVRDNCTACPVALAMRSAFPDAKEVIVGLTTLWIDLEGGSYRCPMPGKLSEFIRGFDRTGRGRPFEAGLKMHRVGGAV
jgi:hypothetical protein